MLVFKGCKVLSYQLDVNDTSQHAPTCWLAKTLIGQRCAMSFGVEYTPPPKKKERLETERKWKFCSDNFHAHLRATFRLLTLPITNMTVEDSSNLKMYLVLNMVIFQPHVGFRVIYRFSFRIDGRVKVGWAKTPISSGLGPTNPTLFTMGGGHPRCTTAGNWFHPIYPAATLT